MSDSHQLCTFRVGDLYLGLPVEKVQEVLRFQRMTRVPMATGVIAGLINLRGQIVTAVDLRCRFGLPPRTPEALPTNVVVRSGEGIVSLLVDEIGDVVEVGSASLEATPATLRSPARELLRGVHKLEPALLLLLLDLEQALAFDAATGAERERAPRTLPSEAR